MSSAVRCAESLARLRARRVGGRARVDDELLFFGCETRERAERLAQRTASRAFT